MRGVRRYTRDIPAWWGGARALYSVLAFLYVAIYVWIQAPRHASPSAHAQDGRAQAQTRVKSITHIQGKAKQAKNGGTAAFRHVLTAVVWVLAVAVQRLAVTARSTKSGKQAQSGHGT